VAVTVVPGKLTVVVTVSVSVGPGAVVVTVTVTVDPGAVVGAVSGLLVVVDVVGMVSEGGIVGVLVEVVVDVVLDVLVGVVVDVLVDISGGVVVDVVVDAVVDVVVDVVDVFVHTGQVVIVDVDVSVTMPSELAISAGDSVEFCLLAKIYSGRVVIVDVPVSVALIGDDPGVVAVIDGVVERLTGIECSRTVEYASDLAWRLLVASQDSDTVTVSKMVSVTVTSSAELVLNANTLFTSSAFDSDEAAIRASKGTCGNFMTSTAPVRRNARAKFF
jgi:hypothetical protein